MNDIELIKKYVNQDNWDDALKKLDEGYPVQYIIGNVEFCGNIINVNENVLIPRFETEYLVEKTLKYIEKLGLNNINVLEVGTGSGCISIALKKKINCDILAIDISKKAIEMAQLNADINNCDINFQIIDIHDYKTTQKYDLIISNPPYIPYNSVVDEKTKYEPQNALFAENDGIYFYKLMLESLKNNLNKDYLIAFEIGDKQGSLIEKIVSENLKDAYFKVEKDYNNFERYAFITNKKNLF